MFITRNVFHLCRISLHMGSDTTCHGRLPRERGEKSCFTPDDNALPGTALSPCSLVRTIGALRRLPQWEPSRPGNSHRGQTSDRCAQSTQREGPECADPSQPPDRVSTVPKKNAKTDTVSVNLPKRNRLEEEWPRASRPQKPTSSPQTSSPACALGQAVIGTTRNYRCFLA